MTAVEPDTRAAVDGTSGSLGRDWRLLWSAGAVSTLGDGALIAALPLLAHRLTQDPREISAVVLAAELPWFLAVIGGTVVDRFDRRRLMVGAQIWQLVAMTAVALAATAGLRHLWPLYVLAFTIGLGDVLFSGANQALVVNLVPTGLLETANGRQIATESVTRDFAGPPLGAALFSFWLPLPFWTDAATFLVSLLLILRIRRLPRQAPDGAPRALSASTAEGLRFLLRNRLLRNLSLMAAASNFCKTMALSTLVLFAHDVLHVGDSGYGVLLAAMAVGGVLGGLVSKRLVDRFGGRTVALTVQLTGPFIWLAIGVLSRGPLVMILLFTLRSASLAVWNVVSGSLKQRLTPNHLLGRVSGAGRMVAYGAIPLGAAAGGLVADSYGLIAPWIIGAALNLVVVVLALPTLVRWERA
ncbi:MFS transporter [Streptomyces sp. NEAU-sy36]|uniref:MFS transporter n=1 Tax=unclassified Streptomyces TaxID=2593676 RepID=UPI0015D659A4|nr:MULTISPECIES: MFS transporter [unclassified Streptomyces]QLJ00578.1 MFS transporter [Streptomyces sp. NEAU-sy36]